MLVWKCRELEFAGVGMSWWKGSLACGCRLKVGAFDEPSQRGARVRHVVSGQLGVFPIDVDPVGLRPREKVEDRCG